ncbi:MAG: thiamine pyrophosphate-binding protein, partial [Elusimicrobiota bacterium]
MPRLSGADIVVRALQDEGVKFTFGIPGTHNTELYDALERSGTIEPVLVTDEQSASFMADAVSRSSDTVGVVNLVPGAGLTNACSGIAEAWMDNVAMVVLACGIRSDTGHAYQLHAIDQLSIVRPICKATLRPASPADIYPTIRKAFAQARQAPAGPVVVEIPADYYLFDHDWGQATFSEEKVACPQLAPQLSAAAAMLNAANKPVLYLGRGAAGAGAQLVRLAEVLQAPVVTTVQGKGVIPEDHPLWLWCGMGRSAPAFVNDALKDSDCMLAIGCRFSEVATASYGFEPPKRLIHVDADKNVFDKNFKAELAIESDAARFVAGILTMLKPRSEAGHLRASIKAGHAGLWK